MAYNGTKVGLKDLHYALLITDASNGATYGTPVKIVILSLVITSKTLSGKNFSRG